MFWNNIKTGIHSFSLMEKTSVTGKNKRTSHKRCQC